MVKQLKNEEKKKWKRKNSRAERWTPSRLASRSENLLISPPSPLLQCHYLCCMYWSDLDWFCCSVLNLILDSQTNPKRFKTTPKFVAFKLLIFSNVPRCILVPLQVSTCWGLIPRGGAPYNGLYGEAPPEMGTFLRLQVRDMKGYGFHLLKYMKG